MRLSDWLMPTELLLSLATPAVRKSDLTVSFNLCSFCQVLYLWFLSLSCLWSDTLRCSGTLRQAPLSTSGQKSLSLQPGSTPCSGLCLHCSAGAGLSPGSPRKSGMSN